MDANLLLCNEDVANVVPVSKQHTCFAGRRHRFCPSPLTVLWNDDTLPSKGGFWSLPGFSEKYEASVDPLWRQTFFLYIRDPSRQSLEVCVESITEDEEEENICLGRAEVKDLESLCDGGIHDMTLELEG